MPSSPFADLLVFQPPSTKTTYKCSVSLTQNATPPVRKTSTPRASKISCQQPLNQPLCEVHLHQNMRKHSKTNPNPTGKTPKKMDSNRKMETQKIPQCADKGKLLFSSEEAQRRQQLEKAGMAVDLRWWVARLNSEDASVVVAKRCGGIGNVDFRR
ncbi:hypothetical protein DEO72_LG2g3257 [Vigna unguiculata]|uniref:Uncharacterized protein n=1 Tax=Vigna unguiculata TaxID=3917 RepID=A0A4D6L378_VIGUN|nr:hypothetical protein DEO72_LG2g3257 [Vigna unguiculata]